MSVAGGGKQKGRRVSPPRGPEAGGERAARGAYRVSRAAVLARGRRAAGAFTGAAAGGIARAARVSARGGDGRQATSVSLALMPAADEAPAGFGAPTARMGRGEPASRGMAACDETHDVAGAR
ncbi:hypothetical protein Bsp3421_005683 [Burkholderia sp. FERM BP-3421]|uniref:hypothetical protein n=1 Tax=Burkholderia sp. FERM BP-3421 TaxID=1494466 RepID=UPI0023600919|nr:hypothetical protein [Burkholderia sp. FERM BP-3421]WDD95507.1 hypothetical protein Bsp3421_005683 [Burkholderia sp. FERM BP-3421]